MHVMGDLQSSSMDFDFPSLPFHRHTPFHQLANQFVPSMESHPSNRVSSLPFLPLCAAERQILLLPCLLKNRLVSSVRMRAFAGRAHSLAGWEGVVSLFLSLKGS